LPGINDGTGGQPALKRNLTVKDLTAFGIAAIIGAGIFSTIGTAASTGGPAISVLFIFTAIACGFSALCYAEFSSRVPVSGSAYTYAYYSFGELIAWVIGWDLLLEYAIGNIAVAISWSDYLTEFLRGFGFHMPEFLTVDYFTAFKAHREAVTAMASGHSLDSLTFFTREGYLAWEHSPTIGNLHLIADFPALIIVILITAIVFVGIRESKTANNIMVGIKLLIIFTFVMIGSFYVKPANWHPFAPNGVAGVLKGVSAVFFAYIGFDAISTTAEECKNPTRDLPRGIFLALLISTVLYVMVALVLTGMVKYDQLEVGDPLSFAFRKVGLNWVSGVVAFTALIAMASVLLIFQLGQPRIWMSMSRDGLLPKIFSRIHPKFKTPSFATIITGLVVGIPAMMLNLTVVTDLTSIGTLFAFIIVCAGILVLQNQKMEEDSKPGFQVPYINGKYIVLPLLVLTGFISYFYSPEYWNAFITGSEASLLSWEETPTILFVIISIWIGILSFRKSLSLIPVLGLLSCLFLMTEMGLTNWLRFIVWLLIGLIVYFTFGRRNSNLAGDQVPVRK
jgi:APA family basic amino acid/polyamine antiporter